MTDPGTVSLSVVLGCLSVAIGLLSWVTHNSVCDEVNISACGCSCLCKKHGRGSKRTVTREPSDTGSDYDVADV